MVETIKKVVADEKGPAKTPTKSIYVIADLCYSIVYSKSFYGPLFLPLKPIFTKYLLGLGRRFGNETVKKVLW